VLSEKIGVHRQVRLDPLEPCDNAGERAHMLAETGDRGPRRHGAIAAAGHDQLVALGQLDRLRRPSRVLQLLGSAGRALWPMRDVMLGDGRAHQVEACDVVAQIGAEARRDRLGDFDGGELDRALPHRVARERRNGDRPRLSAVEETFDFPIPDHAVEQAGPARALAGLEYRPDHGKTPEGCTSSQGVLSATRC